MQTKNVLFTNSTLYTEGDNLFHQGKYDEALFKFEKFLFQFPNSEKCVIGKIAITYLKLKQFKIAEKHLKKAIKLNPEREKEYALFLAECFYGLSHISNDYFKRAKSYCNKYREKYGDSAEIIEIKNSIENNDILPNNDYDILLQSKDLVYKDMECAGAWERLSQKYFFNEDYEEAEYYANKRIQFKDINVINGYYQLAKIYKETESFYKCKVLLDKAFINIASNYDRSVLCKFVLDIYKKSECSQFYENPMDISDIELVPNNNVEQKVNVILEKINNVINNYLPVLDLVRYFNLEPKLELMPI